METKPHKPALLRNYLVFLLRDFFSPLSKNHHKEKDPFESLIKYYKMLKENYLYLITHHHHAGDWFLANQFRYLCPGGEKGNKNKKKSQWYRKERLGWTCWEWTSSTEQQHKALNIPLILQKGRTIYLHQEQKCYTGQELLCLTGEFPKCENNNY